MKLVILTAAVLFLGLGAPAVLGEEPTTTKCEMCEMMKKAAAKAEKDQQSTELAAQNVELEKLVTEMNGSLGSKKVEAMAAVVTRLVEQYKVLHAAQPVGPKAEGQAHQH